MTIMIPEECMDSRPVVKSLHQSLYNQLGPDYKIVQQFKQPNAALTGTLLWLQFKQQTLFIYISDATNLTLKDNPELAALKEFQSRLLPSQLQSYRSQLTPMLMIFSQIDNDQLSLTIKTLGIFIYGKQKLASNHLSDFIQEHLGRPLSKNIHHRMRWIFNPEIAIDSQQKDKSLLDNEQEIAMKMALLLPKHKRRTEHFNLHGVNGGINSGKSEVILQRAKIIHQEGAEDSHKKQRVLILTPDNISQLALEKRYATLYPADKTTEISSLAKWCLQHLDQTKKLVSPDEVSELINRVVSQRLSENGISLSVFLQELDFILGRNIFTEKSYLATQRKSYRYHLSDEQFQHIWQASLAVKNELLLADSLLCTELPQLLWQSLKSKPFKQNYDSILVDDAHLLSPIAFNLIKQAIKPETGLLFITQDPNQRFANACELWKDSGLDLRGHSIRLMSHYQINPYILNAASSFYLHRLPNDLEKVIHRNLPEASHNPMPQLLNFYAQRDETNRLLDKIKRLVHSGVALEEILLICVEESSIHHYIKVISQTLGIKVESSKELFSPNRLGVCSLPYAHGHSASYVFIVGLHHIYEAENNCKKGSDEYQTLLAENTHQLTMAMTCAKKELTLFITSEDIPQDFISPHIDIPSVNSNAFAEVLSLHG